ncbi:hypothetical protein, partial [uncultured Rikenella sp.]|uniref:hypothetical protein n=1 Tax=uncultured Rikenella sp. TaxID=368003 RepID=UPI00260FAFB9
DGTALCCGRVGRRLLQASGYRKITRGFFYSRTVHPSTHERSGFGLRVAVIKVLPALSDFLKL